MGDITALLKRASADEPAAIDEIFALLYDDVHRMARARLAGNQRMTLLDTTGLAHEAYLRLRNVGRVDASDSWPTCRRCCVRWSSISRANAMPIAAVAGSSTSRSTPVWPSR